MPTTTSIFLSGIIVAGVSYFLWRGIPPSMVERHIAYRYQPVMNLFDGVMEVLWRLGYKDLYWFQRLVVSKVYSPMVHPPDATYTVHNDLFDQVGVRVYDWKAREGVTGAVVYIHGGGYTNYDPQFYDPICVDIIYELRVPILSVDYRRAPQFTSPIAMEDSLAAVKHFLKEIQPGGQLQHLRVNPSRVVYMGDSAGGHLAATVVQQLVKPDGTLPRPKAAVLIYPITQSLTMNTPSYLEHENGFVWKRKNAVWSFMAFHQGNSQDNFRGFRANNFTSYATRVQYAEQLNLPQLKHRARDAQGKVIEDKDGEGDPALIERFRSMYEDERNSPLLGDLSQFPATLVVNCELDVLRDDGEMFVQRLKQLGRPVEHQLYHTVHGILALDQRRAPQPIDDAAFRPTPAQAMFNKIITFTRLHLA